MKANNNERKQEHDDTTEDTNDDQRANAHMIYVKGLFALKTVND